MTVTSAQSTNPAPVQNSFCPDTAPSETRRTRDSESFRGACMLKLPRPTQIGDIGIRCLTIRDSQQLDRYLAQPLRCDQTTGRERFVIGMRSNDDGRFVFWRPVRDGAEGTRSKSLL
jgi:hypothetical protein